MNEEEFNVYLLCLMIKEINPKIDLGASYEILYDIVGEAMFMETEEELVNLFQKRGREVKATTSIPPSRKKH